MPPYSLPDPQASSQPLQQPVYATSDRPEDQLPEQPPGGPIEKVETVDAGKVVQEVEEFVLRASRERRPREMQWYLSAAGLEGHHDARFSPITNRLELRKTPAWRRRFRINRIRVKWQAKLAKLVNSQPRPLVIPASSDREDIYNAKGTELVLLYLWRKLSLEAKYEIASGWAEITGKSFWWIRWDPTALARVKSPADPFGNEQMVEAPLGDVAIDCGSAFEVLVDDEGIEEIGNQKRICRVKAERLEDFLGRHPQWRGHLAPDTQEGDLFQFQRQIADLGSTMMTGLSAFDMLGAGSARTLKDGEYILRKEMFEAPCPKYPKGRYALVAGGHLIDYREELPYGFGVGFENPYPCEEFAAELSPGRFWPTTMIEQLLPIQEEYNEYRSKFAEQMALAMHPQMIAPKQARIPKGAYNSEAGRVIEYHYIPGMPPPHWQSAPAIATDYWRGLDNIREEMDAITNIYPSSLGGAGSAKSGFQTNLLQEAADAVHGPARRRSERALERMLAKIRHLAAIGYEVPRLISVAGRSNIPQVLEFKGSQIDTFAEVKVQIGSALPDHKSSRVQAILELHGSGLFGDPADPNVRRRVLSMIDIGGYEEDLDTLKRDADEAQLENLDAGKGLPLRPPMPWQRDAVHIETHFDLLKSPEFRGWPPEQQVQFIRHVILHLKRAEPPLGLEMAQVFGQKDLVDLLWPIVNPPQMPGAPPMGAPPPPGGMPPGPPPPAQEQAPPPGPPMM